MRLYSFYASQIVKFEDECIKLLALNSSHNISQKDLEKFITKLSDLNDMFHARDFDDFFAKK